MSRRTLIGTKKGRIYIGGIDRTFWEDDLWEEFRKYGKILYMHLKDSYAFLEYSNYEDAVYAC